jgi:murein DD-endopeptidase MepM/ murein hydrolase activator NlpD
LVLTTTSNAGTIIDVLRLYGYENVPDLNTKRVELEELYEEYREVAAEYNTSLWKERTNHAVIVALSTRESKLLSDIEAHLSELENAKKNIENAFLKSRDEIFKADTEYRGIVHRHSLSLSELETVQYNLKQALESDIVYTVTKEDLSRLESTVTVKVSEVTDLENYPNIGRVGGNSHPLAAKTSITSPFGWRIDPMDHSKMQFHKGADFIAREGTPVLAQFHGVVESTYTSLNGGMTIVLDHGKGLRTVYLHLKEFKVKEGNEVKQGQTIAYSGNTGVRTTGPHLHFGIYIAGEAVDPSLLYRKEKYGD